MTSIARGVLLSHFVFAVAGDGVKLSPNFVVVSLFTSNFIGIALARSLHYQFYCWYFFSLPYLLCHTALPAVFKLAVLLGIEIAFNVYPATPTSSLLLQVFRLYSLNST